MDISYVISKLQLLLDQYKEIDTTEDLAKYIRIVKSNVSLLNIFDTSINILVKSELSLDELSIYYYDLQEIILNDTGNKFPEIDRKYDMYLGRHVCYSYSLNRMLAAAYAKGLLIIYDFDTLNFKDYIELVKIENSLQPYLRDYIKEYYRTTIQLAIQKFLPPDEDEVVCDPNQYQNNIEPTEITPKSNSDKVIALAATLDRLQNSYGKPTTFVDYLPIRRESSDGFKLFMNDVLRGNNSEDVILKFLDNKTNSFQLEKLEIVLYYVVNYIISSPEFRPPTEDETENRKNELAAKGEILPSIESYSQIKKRLIKIDDVEKLFPDRFKNYNPLRNIIFRKMQENIKSPLPVITEKKKIKKHSLDKKQSTKSELIEYFKIEDPFKRQTFLEFLVHELKGKKGKTIAFWISALNSIRLGNHCKLLEYDQKKSLYEALRACIGYIGTDSSINKYINTPIVNPVHKKAYNMIIAKINGYLNTAIIN
jgi:hypothetical protein